MVGIDAKAEQPRVVSTFTTRAPVSPARLREASAQIMRLVRQELGVVRYCSFLEFTTGRSERSGGLRRPHLHTLWKEVDGSAAPVIAGCAGHVLEKAAGAWRHDVEEIRSPAGATMYVARHHLKESQAPPAWWGPTRRVRPSRGYWSRPSTELRSEAVAIVRYRRMLKRLTSYLEETGQVVPDDVVEEHVEAELDRPPPEVVRVCKPWEDPLAA